MAEIRGQIASLFIAMSSIKMNGLPFHVTGPMASSPRMEVGAESEYV
jgi:hypothetical protein